MILTVDIGNSRIKVAQWQAGLIVARKVSSPADVDVVAALDVLFSGVDPRESQSERLHSFLESAVAASRRTL